MSAGRGPRAPPRRDPPRQGPRRESPPPPPRTLAAVGDAAAGVPWRLAELAHGLEAPEEIGVQDAGLRHELEARFPALLQRIRVGGGGGRERRGDPGAECRHRKGALAENVP